MVDVLTSGVPAPAGPLSVLAVGRRSLVYALGGLAYKGVALLAVPILARVLTPAELGVLDLAAVLATISGLVIGQGTEQGIAYLEPRLGERGAVWSSAVAAMGIVAVLLLAAAALVAEPVAEIVFGDPDRSAVVVALAAYGGCIALTTTALNAVRLHGTAAGYARASFLLVTAEMGIALLVLWLFDAPVEGMVLGWCAGALLVGIPLIVMSVPSWGLPSVTSIRRLLSFGFPLVPAAIAWFVGDAWIRAVVANELPPSDLGAYGIAYRLSSVIVLLVTGFGVAWYPYLFRSPAHTVVERAAAVLAYLLLSLGTVAAVVTLLAPDIIRLVAGPGYVAAAHAVGPLALGSVALGAFILVSGVTGASGSSRRIALAALLGMIVQIVAAGLLVSAGGLAGAGFASLAGYVVAAVALVGREMALVRFLGLVVVAAVVAFAGGSVVVATAVQELPLHVRVGVGVGVVSLAAGLALAVRSMQART